MSLNTNTPRWDLCSDSYTARHASWAVFWLGEHLWDTMTRRYGKDTESVAGEYRIRANESAYRVYAASLSYNSGNGPLHSFISAELA